MEHESVQFFRSSDRKIASFFYRPTIERHPLVVFSHGLTNSHTDAPVFAELRQALLAEGYPVFMFDYLGSGLSEGSFEDKTWENQRVCLGDALDFSSTLDLRVPGVLLFGRSVGAALCGFFLHRQDVKGAVLASAPYYLESAFGRYRSRAVGGYVAMPDELERSGQIRGQWKLPIEFFDQLASTEQQLRAAVKGAKNTLLVQGLDDPKVDRSHADGLFNQISQPKKLVAISGADHYYTNFCREVIDATISWYNGLER